MNYLFHLVIYFNIYVSRRAGPGGRWKEDQRGGVVA